MGDGGSLPLGFLVASLVMGSAAANSPGLSAVVVAALLVGLVVLDTTLVVFSRARGGRGVLVGGRDHLTHRLAKRLGSPRRVVLALGTAQLALCAVTVSVAAVNVLWILMVGSVAATFGVFAIAALERSPWFARASAVAVSTANPAFARTGLAEPVATGWIKPPITGVAVVSSHPLVRQSSAGLVRTDGPRADLPRG
jgi:hypothetical protein